MESARDELLEDPHVRLVLEALYHCDQERETFAATELADECGLSWAETQRAVDQLFLVGLIQGQKVPIDGAVVETLYCLKDHDLVASLLGLAPLRRPGRLSRPSGISDGEEVTAEALS
jgi:hypothetical protein